MNKNSIKAIDYAKMIEIKNQVQREAIKAVMAEFALAKQEGRKPKAVLNLATGAGKTRTAWKFVFEQDGFQTIIFMVPKMSLVNQTIEEWQAQGIEFDYATAYSEGDIKSVEDLEYFMSMPSDRKKVIFAVYNTVGLTEDSDSIFADSDIQFDLAIYDECHRVAGKDMGLFTSCVTDEVVKAKHKLFMTATVKFYTEDDTNDDDDPNLNEYSMMNEDIFGKIAYSLTIFEAIKLGILCRFETYLLEVTDTSIRKALQGVVNFHGEDIKGQHLATFYGVLNAYNQGARKILAIYRQRSDARDFNNLFKFVQQTVGLFNDAVIESVASDVTAAELGAPHSYVNESGNTIVIGNDNRKAQQWWLKYGPFCQSEVAIATSSPWIKEGEDIPCIDCIVFGDRFKSGIDIIQTIGRALRWSEGKELARIILPIMEGEANKVARQIQAIIGTLQNEVNEFQIVYTEATPQSTDVTDAPVESEIIPAQNPTNTNPIANHGQRWIMNENQNGITTLTTNNEMSVNLIHDTNLPAATRYQHEQMMQAIGLKVTNQYQNYIRGQRAKNFVKNVVRNIEEGVNMYAHLDGKRTLHATNDPYIQEYATKYDLSIEAANTELSNWIHLLDTCRMQQLMNILPF